MSFASLGPAPAIAPVSDYAGPQSNPYNTGPITQRGAELLQQQAPAAPAVPVDNPNGAKAYSRMDAAGQQAAQTNWLGGDSDYASQLGEYNDALAAFTDRIAKQKGDFTTDTNNAITANTKNRDLSGNQLGEDFGARGMSYSGLFDKSKNLMYDRYGEQEKNINNVGNKNQTDADNRLSDFSHQNTIDISNAKRAALGRLFQNQQMIDSQTTF